MCFRDWSSYYPRVFNRMVCDEAQKLKSPNTLTLIAVSKLEVSTMNFLSATPMINRPVDLLSLLQSMWQDEFTKPEGDDNGKLHSVDNDSDITIDDFITCKADFNKKPILSKDNRDRLLDLLNPKAFSRHISTSTIPGNKLYPHITNMVLPVVLRLIQLRRTILTVVDVGPREARVPPKPYEGLCSITSTQRPAKPVPNLCHCTLSYLARNGQNGGWLSELRLLRTLVPSKSAEGAGLQSNLAAEHQPKSFFQKLHDELDYAILRKCAGEKCVLA